MRELKESNISWIGEIPKGWQLLRIKSVLRERNEKNYPIKTTKILSLSAKLGVTLYKDKVSSGNKAKEDLSAYKVIYDGDIVINSMNILSGSVGISKYYGCTSPVYFSLTKKNDNDTNLFYYLLFSTGEFQKSLYGLGNGILIKESASGKFNTIRMRIPTSKFNCLSIPIPPSCEQKKIVNFLDNKVKLIDNIISQTKESIEYYKQYKQSLITEVVTKGINPNAEMKESGIEWIGKIPKEWKVLRLKDIFFFQKGLPITKDNLTKTGIKVISYGQIHNTKNEFVKIVDELFRYVSPIYIKSNKSSLVNFGEYIFADTSEDLQGVGNFVLMDKVNEPIFAGYHTIILKNKNFNNLYLKKYLGYLFLTDNWRNQIRSRVNGVKLFSITQKILSKVQIIIPPLTEQGLIVDKLDLEISKINKLIDNKNKIIIELEDYKKSLIYEVVTGKKEIN